MSEPFVPKPSSPRLASLDALRGFDLLMLTMVGPVLHVAAGRDLLPAGLVQQFSHMPWQGFTCWDLVMPLFLFMAGVSIPVAFAKYAGEGAMLPKSRAYVRIARRVAVLWVLGCIAQGNLLALDLAVLKPFSNTLQAIAVGYAGAALCYLWLGLGRQLLVAGGLLLAFWVAMRLGGDWTPAGNLAEKIDIAVFGKWRDGASVAGGGIVNYSPHYHYTWILSSLNFTATVLSGVAAGSVLRSARLGSGRKFLILAGAGALAAAVGWLLDVLGVAPVIKPIWSSSMVLVSSGYSTLLLAGFFAVTDWAGWKRWAGGLQVIGTNSIVAYMLSPEAGVISFASITQPLLAGLRQWMAPGGHEVLVASGNAVVLFLVLALLHRARVFLRP